MSSVFDEKSPKIFVHVLVAMRIGVSPFLFQAMASAPRMINIFARDINQIFVPLSSGVFSLSSLA